MDNGIISSFVYSPTVTLFDKCIFVNYRKVGTRYVSGIASYPLRETEDCYQLELFTQTNPQFDDTLSMDVEKHKLSTQLYDYYVYTIFDIDGNKNEIDKYKKFTNSRKFLDYCNVTNFNEFFYKNPRDLYFVIRNPIDRFISGAIQMLITNTTEIIFDRESRDELKFYTKLQDRELKDAIKILSTANSNVDILDKLPTSTSYPIIHYFIEKKWNLIFDDSHTEPYLYNFREWMYNIEDKSKLKIIDISQFSSNKSKELIKNVKSNFDETDSFNSIESFKSSNKKVYSDFLIEYSSKNLSFYNYLKNELQIYWNLRNSKFFIDLSDEDISNR